MTIFQRPVNFKLSLVATAIALLALSATADRRVAESFNPDRIVVKHAHSQVNPEWAGEAVELLVELRVPGGSVPTATLVEYIILVMNANGEPIGEFLTSAPVRGYAKVRLETAIDRYGPVLLANGETLGPIEPEHRSSEVAAVDYAVEVRVRRGINPRTGETIQIPASTTPKVASFVFDKATGQSLFANDCSAAAAFKPGKKLIEMVN